mgnify:CR=1 FL=1
MTGPRWLRKVLGAPAGAMVAVVRLYQATLSYWLGGQCRFSPSCSEYFIQAVRQKGALRGAALGFWRLLRCHPFSRGGYDPIPTDDSSGRGGGASRSARKADQ